MRLLSAIVWATFGVGAFAGYAALAGPAPEAHVCYFGQIVELTLPPNTREGVYVADPVGVQWGPPRPAMQRQCLLPGQKIFVEAAGPEALVREAGRRTWINIDNPKLIVSVRPTPEGLSWLSTIQSLARIFDNTPQKFAIETFGRGPGRGIGPARPTAGLAARAQLVPRGQASLTVIWKGEPATIELETNAGLVVASRWKVAESNVVLDRLNLNGAYRLKIADNSSYELSAVDPVQIPEPDWRKGHASTSDDERAVRAVWILSAGPPDWRLFALDELRVLHASSFLAERAWEAELSGESLSDG